MKPERVDASDWVQHFARLQSEGLRWFDFLTAIDRDDHVDVVGVVADSAHARSSMVVTAVFAELASLTGLFPGASWHERETQEMFGIRFIGLPDSRPLIHRSFMAPPPMRRSQAT